MSFKTDSLAKIRCTISLPYDWRKLWPFVATGLLQLIILICIVIPLMTSAMLNVGNGQILSTFPLDIQRTLNDISEEVDIAKQPLNSVKALEIKARMNEIVKTHYEFLR